MSEEEPVEAVEVSEKPRRHHRAYGPVRLRDGERPPSRIPYWLNIATFVAAIPLIVLMTLNITGPARIWLSVFVFAVGGGSGMVQFLRIPDNAFALGLVFALSAAVDILLGQTLLGIHRMGEALTLGAILLVAAIKPWPFVVRGLAKVPEP